jgi:uncharacterized protein YkwD
MSLREVRVACKLGPWAVLLAASLGGCLDEAAQAFAGGGSCGSTCELADDCYSLCFCEHEDTGACERRCGARGVRVQDLDESAWPAESTMFEGEVLRLTNEARAQGGCCGGRCFEPAAALQAHSELTSAARAHAFDMGQRGYFDHESPDGLTPADRIREAGFKGCALGENIAAGQATPAEVVQGWLDSPGHCANMLTDQFDRLGVGYHPASVQGMPHLWVQAFGG